MASSEPVTRLHPPRRTRAVRWAAVVIAAGVLCALFPPFRIVKTTGAAAATKPSGHLSAKEFWDQRLTRALDKATDAKTLIADVRRDPKRASEKHGRRVGIGGPYYYFLRGTGRVVSADANSIGVALDDEKDAAVMLEAGNIFGNNVRDGTGLLDVNEYATSEEFNDLSAELNKIVEERVLPKLREQAKADAQLQFTGVAEINEEETDLRPLRVVPLSAEVHR
jgi:predicted lipoprotein